MKKIKNKFIITVIWLLIIILSLFFIRNTDNNLDSKAILKLWEANVYRWGSIISLEPKIPFILSSWDKLTTQWSWSLLIIKWWDGSVTRLWENSSMIVNSNAVSNDLAKINISFELLAWKTWSNVISFFWEESYFIQTFNDNEAAVRGTIFNVDLENDYLHVSKHAVSIKNISWKTQTIWESQAFNIETFTFISLIDFIKNYKDESWKIINSELDKIHLEELKKLISSKLELTGEYLELDKISNKINNIKDISILDNMEKNEIYSELLTQYQKIHFANAQTPELLSLKLEIKEVLLQFANNKNEEYLVNSTVYDLQEVKKTNNPIQFQTIINIFSEHENILNDLDIYFPDIINIEKLSEEFQAVLYLEIDKISSLVRPENIELIKNLRISDFDLDLSKKSQNFLDNNLPKDEIQSFLQKLIQWFQSFNK